MEKLSIEWKRFENLANRALLIIAHLNKIAESCFKLVRDLKDTGTRKRLGFDKVIGIGSKTTVIDVENWRLMIELFQQLDFEFQRHYSYFKGLIIAIEEVIKINEGTKQHTEHIEARIKDGAAFERSGEGSTNWNHIAKEIGQTYLSFQNEEKLAERLLDRLDRFLEKLKPIIKIIIERKELFDIDEQLKVMFFVNWGKLIGIFDEMNKLLNNGKPQEKYIRQLFDEIYNLLSHFPKEYTPTHEIELVIQKLEQAYDAM